MNKHIRRGLYATLILTSLASIGAAGGSAYWLYQNSNVELTKITQPDTSQPIVAEDQATDGVTYDGSVEITSTEQLQEYRNDTSQPLYLRNYLSMPSLGINLQIYEGTSNRVLTYGAGTIKTGQIVDSFANYAVAAHNFSDAQWGHGFSMLQTYPDVYGRQAYISDGDYVYTYTMVSYDNVYRDDSMKYTEDDWRQQFLQEQIKTIAPKEYTQEVTPERLYNADESYVDNTEGKTFTYGKLLTLYTCYLEGYYHDQSWNRIIVTGVMTKKQKLSEAPQDVQALFLDPAGNLTVTNSEEVPAEAQAAEADAAQALNKESFTLESKVQDPVLVQWWNQTVARDQGFPMTVVIAGMAVFLVSILALIILNRIS